MGQNRRHPNPDLYPIAFLNAIRDGGAVIPAASLPWTMLSAAKRFRLCLAVCRETPSHPLHGQSCNRWSVQATKGALVITCLGKGHDHSLLNASILDRALSPRSSDPRINREKP